MGMKTGEIKYKFLQPENEIARWLLQNISNYDNDFAIWDIQAENIDLM